MKPFTIDQLNWVNAEIGRHVRQQQINHERAEEIIRAREATIAELRERLDSETARANELDAVCGEIKQALGEMGAPIAGAIGCRRENGRLGGRPKKTDCKCYNCDGEGFVEDPEFEINACERCGGSGVLPNVAISQPEDGKHTL